MNKADNFRFRIHKTDEIGRILSTYGIGGNSWHNLEKAREIKEQWGGCIMEYGPHSTQPLWEIF